jgi:hypothetical protein
MKLRAGIAREAIRVARSIVKSNFRALFSSSNQTRDEVMAAEAEGLAQAETVSGIFGHWSRRALTMRFRVYRKRILRELLGRLRALEVEHLQRIASNSVGATLDDL